MFKVSRR